MPRKPSFSPTKLTTYLACPHQYFWTYVDHRGRFYLRSKRYYSFGASLHRVLERLHDAGDEGVKTVGQAVAALEESWIDAGYESPQEMQEALGEGKALLSAYVERLEESPPLGTTRWVERMVRADLGPFFLVGRLDRLDEWPDGTLEIVDYKSGRAAVDEAEVRDDLAMGCYQILVREQFPGRAVVATINALRAGTSATAALADGEIADLRSAIVRLGETILGREWESAAPIAKPLCPGCDFLPLCRRHPHFDATRIPESPDPADA